MDPDHKVDNEPSIRLLITTPTEQGVIFLSSIYGSYNFVCTTNIDENSVCIFYCPQCRSEITAEEHCSTCQAPMATLILDIGGKLNFCTRRGCQNHNIGFEDLSNALTKFYQEFGFRGRKDLDAMVQLKETKKTKTQAEENKEIIETGFFLQSYCPHCRRCIIENDMLKIKVTKPNGESGFLLLSPYLNVFTSKSTIFLPEEQTIGNLQCPHCDKSFIVNDGKCDRCGDEIAKILVSARTKMIEFYICAKKGCTWHGLSDKDMEEIRLEDSIEW
jgi:hypothetical protein